MNKKLFCYRLNYLVHLLFIPESIEQLPPGLLRAADTLEDRLVKKAAQLIHNKTTNLYENLMSIHCKIDGGKFTMGYNQASLTTDAWQLLVRSSVVLDG